MATSSPNLTSTTYPVESIEAKVAKAIALSVVSLVAILGNSLVVTAVWKNVRMRTVINYLIVNMAVADLLYTVIAVPPFYVQIFELFNWSMSSYERGVYFCKVVNFGQYLLVPVSVLTLAAIAADRFFAILVPLKKILTKRVYCVIVVAIWMVAGALAAPILYAYRVEEIDGFVACYEDWGLAFDGLKASRIYSIVLFATAYCVPFLAITIMYTVICRQLWLRKIPGEHAHQNKKILKSRKKVVKMLITVVIAFILCWLPVQIATFLWEYSDIEVPEVLNFVCMFLMRAHAGVSPCIFAVFSENYRRGFKDALTGRCRKKYKATDMDKVNSPSLSTRQLPCRMTVIIPGCERKLILLDGN